MNSVIIFDVTNNATALVVEKMITKGYYKNWKNENKIVNLPHNIVWKPNTESTLAVQDIKEAVEIVNSTIPCKLLRCVVLNSTPWRAMFGTPI